MHFYVATVGELDLIVFDSDCSLLLLLLLLLLQSWHFTTV